MTGKRIADQKFLFLGAGEAGLGVANLLVLLLRDMGVNPADAYKKIWLYDGNLNFWTLPSHVTVLSNLNF